MNHLANTFLGTPLIAAVLIGSGSFTEPVDTSRAAAKEVASVVSNRIDETSKTITIGPSDNPAQTLTLGGVTAKIEHQKKNEDLLQAKVSVFLHELKVAEVDGVETSIQSSLLQIAELDPSNPYKEVVLSTYSGGAHCCSQTSILTSSRNGTSWSQVDIGWLDGGPIESKDLNADGRYEFKSYDNRFLYKFSSYAGSLAPTRILRLDGTNIVDATRDPTYRSILRGEVDELEARLQGLEKRSGGINGFLAGYVATKALIGQREDAWTKMLVHFNPDAASGLTGPCLKRNEHAQKGACDEREYFKDFPSALESFLIETGYF